jgi:hypothetical protein
MKKLHFIAVLLLSVMAVTLTTCASTGGGSRKPSEIIVNVTSSRLIYSFDKNMINVPGGGAKSVTVTAGGKEKGVSYPVNLSPVGGELGQDAAIPATGLERFWEGTVTIPVANGSYTVSCAGTRLTLELNNNRAIVEVNHFHDNYWGNKPAIALISNTTRGDPRILAAIDAAAPKVFKDIDPVLSAKLPPNAAIAVFPINAKYAQYAEIALEELQKQFNNSGKYTVVEKRRVEELLAEYDFQKSGMVGEKTLGELLGADVVIFSTLSDEGMINSWAVSADKYTTLAKTKSLDAIRVLPEVNGGTADENETIASFLQYARKEEPLPASVQQVGRKRMLFLGTPDLGISGRVRLVINYADALELWVKLQQPNQFPASSAGRLGLIWSQFGAGVDRDEAEMLTSSLIADTLSIPYKTIILRQFIDGTRAFEETLQTIPQTVRWDSRTIENPVEKVRQWRAYIKTPQFLTDKEYHNVDLMRGLNALTEQAGFRGNYPHLLEWSKRGGRTRVEAVYAYIGFEGKRFYFSYSMEYGSQQEFFAKMRGLSLFILTSFSENSEIWGLNSYNLSTAVAPAPVPANFTRIKPSDSQQESASVGGFYIGTVPVTQREYESIMKQNPSVAKNPAQSVNNVSVIDAMMYCNQRSILEGLEPAYLIEYEGAHRDWLWGIQEETITNVTLDRFATGYRLPTTDEWKYAAGLLKQMEAEVLDGKLSPQKMIDMGFGFTMGLVTPEYVFDGGFEQVAFFSRSAGDRRRSSYMGLDGNRATELLSAPLLEGSSVYEVGRAVQPYEQDLGEVTLEVFRVAADGTRIPMKGRRVRIAPVIRMVRPVFDYWKYTTGQ